MSQGDLVSRPVDLSLPPGWHSEAKFPLRTQFNDIQLKDGFSLGEYLVSLAGKEPMEMS